MADLSEMATILAELQNVVTAQQAEMQAMRVRQQQLQQQQQQQGQQQQVPGRAVHFPPDTRLGQPPVFVGDENVFDNWAFKLKAYIGNQSAATLELMRKAETMTEPLEAELYDVETEALATSLYYKLAMLTDRAALAIVRQVTTNDGFEAYRRLVMRYNPRTMGRGLSRLAQLLSFDFGSDESQLLDKILQWERLIDEYEKGGAETVSDSVRCAVMQSRAPAAVRTHLLLNAPMMANWPAMRKTIQNYLIAASSSAAPVPMEIGSIGKARGKGKTNGKFKDSGKHSVKQDQAKGNGKSPEKGKYHQQRQKGWGSGNGHEQFTGYCGRCGKKGHKQKDCWSKIVGAVEAPNETASSSDCQWHRDEAGWSSAQNQGWWREQAAGGTAPETLNAVTAVGTPAGDIAAPSDDAAWILALTGGEMSGGGQRPQAMIDLMVDSGAERTVCGPHDFPGVPIDRECPKVELHGADGRTLKWYGRKVVAFHAQGERLKVVFSVVDVTRPILSVANMTDNGNEITLGRTGGEIRSVREGRARRLGLLRCAGLFLLRVALVEAMTQGLTPANQAAAYLAPVSGGAFQEAPEDAEARWAVLALAPERPSATEVEAHMATHTPYARWCHDCVMGRGRDDRHQSSSGHGPEATPVVQLDYCFARFGPGDPQVPVLCAIDNVYHRSMAVWCDRKGSRDNYAVKAVEEFCKSLGFEKVLLQTDPENSAIDVVHEACLKLPVASPRATPVASKGSNGLVERLHQHIQGLFCTLRSSVQRLYKVPVDITHVINPWMVRHASWIRDRFEVDARDHRTACERHYGRMFAKKVVPFGETVMWREPGPHQYKFSEHWGYGIYLGRAMSSDEHILGTRVGVIRARTVRRLDEDSRYDAQLLLAMRGVPWETRASAEARRLQLGPTPWITPAAGSTAPGGHEAGIPTDPAAGSTAPEGQEAPAGDPAATSGTDEATVPAAGDSAQEEVTPA